MPKICESGKLTRGAPFAAARHIFGAGFRRVFPPNVSDHIDSRIIPVVLLAALSVLVVSFIDEAQAQTNCVNAPGHIHIWLSGTTDVADGTLCSDRDQYYLQVSLRNNQGALTTHNQNVCVRVERLSGDHILASEIGLPRGWYIKAGDTDVTFRMNVDSDVQARTLDGQPVVIVAKSGSKSSTFPLTVVHNTGAGSCPVSPTSRTAGGTSGTSGIPNTGGTSGTSSSSSSSFSSFFVPAIRDATPPIIISMNTTGNATRALGDSGPLLFNITFSEPVYRVDPTDFVLISNNDTLRVPANATSLNATIYPEQVIPHGDMTEFVIDMEPEAAYDGSTISNGTVRFNIEHLSSHFLEVHLTAPDCRTILLHNQTSLLPSDLVKPRTIEQLAGSPLAGPWTLNVQNNARIHNATGHMYGLTLDVGPTIVINGTGSNYLVAINAATNGTLTLGLADDHNIVDLAGNLLAGGVPVGANNTYVLTEPPKRTCP